MSKSVESLVSEVFELQNSKLTDEMSPDTVEQWDSMNHLKLVTAIENEYDIRLSMSEIQSMLTIGEIKNIVVKHSS